MELKFAATVTLSESEIRQLIEAEIKRRYAGIKVTGVAYNIHQEQSYVFAPINGIVNSAPAPVYRLTGVVVTVEKTA